MGTLRWVEKDSRRDVLTRDMRDDERYAFYEDYHAQEPVNHEGWRYRLHGVAWNPRTAECICTVTCLGRDGSYMDCE